MPRAFLGFCLIIFVLLGCEPTRTSTAPKPEEAKPGPPPSEHIIMVEAGVAEASMGRWFIRYVIDKQTRTCWMMIGSSMSQLDCCVLRRATQTRHRVTWESDRSCAARGVPASPSQTQRPVGGRITQRRGWVSPRAGGRAAAPGRGWAPGAARHPGVPRTAPVAPGYRPPAAPSATAQAAPSATAPQPAYRPRSAPTAPSPR